MEKDIESWRQKGRFDGQMWPHNARLGGGAGGSGNDDRRMEECVGQKHTWVAGWVAPTDCPNSAVVLRSEHHISYWRLLLLREESNGSEGEESRRETATHRWIGCEASSLVSEFVRQQGVPLRVFESKCPSSD